MGGINGRTFEMNDVAPYEQIRFGDTEVWEFGNRTSMMAMPHPLHIRAAQFPVLERIGTPPGLAGLRAGFLDDGLKDTVPVLPGESVREHGHLSRWEMRRFWSSSVMVRG